MSDNEIPVLVGCGQITEKNQQGPGRTPVQLMADAATLAGDDSGIGKKLLSRLDTVVAAGLAVDAVQPPIAMTGAFTNVPKTVANLLQISPQQLYYSAPGGNTPQMLVNHFAQQIADGKSQYVLLCGGEALQTMTQGEQLNLADWRDDPGGQATPIGDNRPPVSQHEAEYGLFMPANTYPLFENALRNKYQRTHQQHQQAIGELYHGFTRVAAQNPLAWFPIERSAEELITPSEENRYIAFPYTKYLNSIIHINQSAAVIMTSEANARELGIDAGKLVHLHGCADANDIWNVTGRVDYHSSPALRRAGREALQMAGRTIDDMDFFDIYSCFPSAVEIACDELGISQHDARGLTVTGGLPYFGGPGNNYSTHAIAEMMNTLRAHPGKFGLLNANGWFITKHAIGIYSTTPVQGEWKRRDPDSYQDDILKQSGPAFTLTPGGAAKIETFTVLHNREGPERAIIIGRMQDDTRFLAETPNDAEILQQLMDVEAVGRSGQVSQVNGRNVFVPDQGCSPT